MEIADHSRQLIDLILDSFAEQHQVAVGMFEKNSNGIFSPKAKKYFAPLCSYMRHTEELRKICKDDHKKRGNTSVSRPERAFCICGLVNITVPIIVHEEFQGSILCGQRIIRGETSENESREIFNRFLEENKRVTKHHRNRLIEEYNKTQKVQDDYFDALTKELEESICKLVFMFYFEKKFVEQEKKDLEKRINNVAHEIQIYNQGALSAAERLCEELSSVKLDHTCQMLVQKLPGMLVHLGSVVTNLLWLSTKLHYRFEKIDLLPLIRNTKAYYEWYAGRRDIEIILDIRHYSASVVECSPFLIEQVLNNLLHNAIKYSFKGQKKEGRLRSVHVTVFSEQHYYFCVEFSNYGIGILEDEYEKIYEVFHRGTKVLDERRTGTGIGLSIVKAIIDGHGGIIEVKSIPQPGQAYLNCFTIKLPYASENS